MFSQACVCPQGGLPQCMLGYHPQNPQCMLGYHPQKHPPWKHPPGSTPLRKHTPQGSPLPREAHSPGNGCHCGWHASYWNAFLSLMISAHYCLQTKFAKVMFSQVSVCPQGGLTHCMLGYTHPRTRGRHPRDQRQTPPGQTPTQQTPPGRHPWADTSPWAEPSACWDTVIKRMVRIPLECILV